MIGTNDDFGRSGVLGLRVTDDVAEPRGDATGEGRGGARTGSDPWRLTEERR
jgi:hypothetical protein